MTRNHRTFALRQSLALSTALGVSLVVATPVWGQAGPKGSFGTVTGTSDSAGIGGSPDINVVNQNGGPNLLQVDLNARNTVIEWNGFNVDAGKIANFNDVRLVGNGGEQAVLNRVSGSATRIEGNITSDPNVQVWIVNSAGILLGGGANINVGGLVLSALDLDATNVENFRTTGALSDYDVSFANGRNSTSMIGMVPGATQPASIVTTDGILAMIAPGIDVNVDTKSGTGATAFAIATDVSLQATRGGPLTLTLNQGTRVAGSNVRGTIVGNRVYALITPDAALNTLLNVEASVTNASVDARGVVVLGGESASVDVPLGGGNDDSLVVANTAAGATSLTFRDIDFNAANATSGSVTMHAVGGSIGVDDVAAGGHVTIGNVGPGSVSVTGNVDSGGDYIVTGGRVVLGAAGESHTHDAVGAVTITATAGSIASAGDLRLTGNTSNADNVVMTIGGASTTGLDFGEGLIASGAASGRDILFRNADTNGQFVLSNVFARNMRAQVGAGGNVTAIDRTGDIVFGGLSLSGSNTIGTSANLAVNGAIATVGALTLAGGAGVTVSGALTNPGSSTGNVTIDADVDPGAGVRLATTDLAGILTVNSGGGGIRFDSLLGSGNKSLTAAGIIQGGQNGTVAIGGSGAVTLTTGASSQDIAIGGSIGSSSTSVASLNILRAGQVLLGPLFVAGATGLGAAAPLGSLLINGPIVTSSLMSRTVGSAGFDAVTVTGTTPATGGIDIATMAGDLTVTGALTTAGTVGATGTDISLSSGGAASAQALYATRAVQVSATGAAGVAGNVTAGTSYAVDGASVTLGGDGVTQQAGTTLRAAAAAGIVAGGAGLTLISGSGDITLGGAGTTGLQFGGATLGAGGLTDGSGIRNIVLATDTAARPIALGSVIADRLARQVAGGPALIGSVAVDGDLSFGNLTLGTAGGANAISATGALTVGNAGVDSIRVGGPLSLTAGTTATVNGRIVDIGAATAPVAITGFTIDIDDAALNGRLTLSPGDGGIGFGVLTGSGARSIVTTGGITGVAIEGAGDVTLGAGGGPITISGGIGTTGPVGSLTIDGGTGVTLGTAGSTATTLNVAGAVTIGATARPGSLVVNGGVITGGNFTARTIGAIDLDTVADLTATPGTLSLTTASGPIGFADLLGAGAKTIVSGGGIQGSTIAGPGAVTLTAAGSDPVTLSSIGTVGGAVAALTINGGSAVTLGPAGSTATNVVVAGSISIGPTPGAIAGSLTVNGALTTGSISAATTGITTLGPVTSSGAASFKAGSDVVFANVNSGGTLGIVADGAVRGGTLIAGGGVGVTSAGATSIIGGGSGSGGDFAVSAGGDATISGAVSASGGYRVRGASVTLGGDTVVQSANGLVDITAANGSMIGRGGLTLAANADGVDGESLVLDGSGGPVQFGGTTLIGGTAQQRGDVRIRVGTPATPVTLGIITARALAGTNSTHDAAGALSTAGDVAVTAADLQQSLSITSSGGAITLGTITVSNAGQGVTLTTQGSGGDIRVTSLTAPGAVSIGARGAAAIGSASAGTLSIRGASAALDTATVGGAVDIASSAGSVTLGTALAGGAASLTSAGDLTLASLQSGGTATINAAGNAEMGRVRVTTGDLLVTAGRDVIGPGGTHADMAASGAGGDIRITAGRNALLGSVAGADEVAVTAASIDATSVAATTGSLSLNATAGNLVVAEGIAGGAATLAATGRIAATRLTAAGIDTIAGSSLSGTDLVSTGALTARAGTTIDYARATGTDIGMTAGGTITLGEAGASGALNLTSSNGALALGTATAGGGTTFRSGAGTTATSVRSTGAANVNAGGAIRIGVLDGAGVTSTGASIDVSSVISSGALSLTATGGGVTVGTGVVATTATLAAAGPLSITTSLTAAGDVAATAAGAVTLASVSSTAGSVTASGASIAATTLRSGTTMSLDATAGALSLTTGTAGAAATLRSTGAMNAGTLTAGGAAVLTAGSTLSTTTLNATGAASLNATGATTLGATTAGGAVGVTGNGVTAGRTIAGADLTVTSGGALSVASAQAGGDALFDARAAATIGSVTAGSASGITIRATDATITGSQSAARVSFINRAPASTAFKLGNGTSAEGFALSQDEVNFVNARALTFDAGSGSVEVGTLAFADAAGGSSVDVLTTGRIDILGAVSGGGAGRTFRLGGTANDIADKANVIQLVTTTTGGARLLMNDADLDLRGARIGAGQSPGFLDTIDFDQATGLSPNAVAAAFVGNVDSSLYNPTFGGTVYAPPGVAYLTANSLTVRYSDYALFQNSGAAGTNAGVALGSAVTPVDGALVIQASGNVPSNSFAIFGTINGIDGTSTALLGSAVIGLTGANVGATRINGCIVGSGAGCLTSVVSQPALSIFDSSRIDVFRSVDDLVLPFDPVIGSSNEALFSGITLLDTPADASDCVLGSADCAAAQGGAK